MGRRERVDHAGAAHCARQRRPRGARARHERFHRLELQRGGEDLLGQRLRDATTSASGSNTTPEAVDYLLWRFLRVPTAQPTRDALVSFLTGELGTDSLERARSYMEDALRMTVHLIMSTPEYQIV